LYSTTFALKDIREYEKYTATIKYLEDKIGRIAMICNIPHLIGETATIKWRRQSIVKDVIDLLLIHNKIMKKIYRTRRNKLESTYGIISGMSNLFFFPLENNIFKYSTKDKDIRKNIKRNNVLIYIIFLIILELSNSQIIYMGGDKICNYHLFEKFGYSLFNNLKIIYNNSNNTTPIKKYKTLCYVIYFMSCMLIKYNMWYYESKKKKKFDPVIQKTIIYTLVDFINSVMEQYAKMKKK